MLLYFSRRLLNFKFQHFFYADDEIIFDTFRKILTLFFAYIVIRMSRAPSSNTFIKNLYLTKNIYL